MRDSISASLFAGFRGFASIALNKKAKKLRETTSLKGEKMTPR